MKLVQDVFPIFGKEKRNAIFSVRFFANFSNSKSALILFDNVPTLHYLFKETLTFVQYPILSKGKKNVTKFGTGMQMNLCYTQPALLKIYSQHNSNNW